MLEDFVQRCLESKGLMFNRNMEILRNYLNTMPEEEIIKEIYQLEIIDHLRLLWSAGLRRELQRHSLIRYEQIKGGKK